MSPYVTGTRINIEADRAFLLRFTRREQDQLAVSILARGETVAFTRDGASGSIVLDVASSAKPPSRIGKRNKRGSLATRLETQLKAWQQMLERQAEKEAKRSRKKTTAWQQEYVKAAKAELHSSDE